MSGNEVRVGEARIRMEVLGVVEQLDRITEGAASQFVRASSATLSRIKGDAVQRWPVRTGLSRDSFEIDSDIKSEEIEVSLANDARNRWGSYAYKIRWSVRTEDSIRRQIEQEAGKAKDPRGRAAAAKWWAARLMARHGKGAPSAAMAGRQPWRVLVRTPGEAAAKPLAKELQTELDKLAGRS